MKLRSFIIGLMFSALVALGQATEPTVVINEIVAINDSGLKDEDGDFSDWIELHNYGTESINLTGTALTDNRKRLANWTFPETQLEPGQFVVVFMSGKDKRVAGEPLHADLVAERFGNRLAEREGDVFHRMVAVDVEISVCGHTEINASVPPELVEHVIEKGQAGRDLGGPSAIEVDVHLDRGLGRVP